MSALAVNWAYTKEHDAAVTLPPLSPRRPFRSLGLLLGNRGWLIGFGTETAGWLVYVAALRLAPLSLVQAVSASGIAVLALFSVHGHPGQTGAPRTVRRRHRADRARAALALVDRLHSLLSHTARARRRCLACSLGRCSGRSDRGAHPPRAGRRARACRRVALRRWRHLREGRYFRRDLVARARLAGRLLRSGDERAPVGVPARQRADRRRRCDPGDERRPDRGGFVLFAETLPAGAQGALQIAAFASIVASAALLGGSAATGGAPKAITPPTPASPTRDGWFVELARSRGLSTWSLNVRE